MTEIIQPSFGPGVLEYIKKSKVISDAFA